MAITCRMEFQTIFICGFLLMKIVVHFLKLFIWIFTSYFKMSFRVVLSSQPNWAENPAFPHIPLYPSPGLLYCQNHTLVWHICYNQWSSTSLPPKVTLSTNIHSWCTFPSMTSVCHRPRGSYTTIGNRWNLLFFTLPFSEYQCWHYKVCWLFRLVNEKFL